MTTKEASEFRAIMATALGLFFLLLPLSGGAWAEFNRLPSTPSDRTTGEQDDLVKIARTTQGDFKEEAQMQACISLMNDSSAPYELRRWANLRLITLNTYVGSVRAALEIGREWLRTHSDDDLAQHVRLELARILAQVRNESFRPAFEEVESAFTEFFANAREPSIELIRARILYLRELREAASYTGTSYAELRDRALQQLDLAEAEANAILDMEVPADFATYAARARWLHDHEMNKAHADSELKYIKEIRKRLLHPEEYISPEAKARQEQRMREHMERQLEAATSDLPSEE